MAILRVTYRIRAHHMSAFEKLFVREVLPLTRRHDLKLLGFWRTLVGNAGEYLELWEFKSMADFERSWKGLLKDPELEQVFQRTGPLVEDENFSLLEAVDLQAARGQEGKM